MRPGLTMLAAGAGLGLLAIVLMPSHALAAITVGDTTTRAADASSFSFAHDSQGYDLLIVRIIVTGGKNISSTPTYAGQSLTLIQNVQHSGGEPRVIAYYLVNPPAGSNTLSGSFNAANKYLVAATNVDGVETTNPVAGAVNTETKGASISVNVTSAPDDLVMDVVATKASSLTVGAGQATQFNLEIGGVGASAMRSAGSSEAGATTVTMSWTKDGGKEAVMIGWNVHQACTAVSDASYVAATAQSGQVIAYWSSADPALILRKTAPFAGEAPTNRTTYTVGAAVGAATVVDNDSVAKTSFTQSALTNGTSYYYKVFGRAAGPCYSPGTDTEISATPQAGPHPAWSYTLAGGSMLGPGVAGSGTIYTSSNGSRIISLNTSDGTQSWAPVGTTEPVQGWVTWFPPSDGGTPVVIAGDQSGKVYSVNTSTGATNWQPTLSGADEVQAGVAVQLRGFADATFQATFTTDVAFAATRNSSSTNNKVFALRASDGAVLWTFNGTGANEVDYIVGMPFVDYARNRLYVASRAGASGTQNSLWVLDGLNGAVLASYAVGHIETSPTLSYDGGTLYVTNTSGDLYALNAATLAMKWTGPAALGSAVKGFVWEDFGVAGRLYFTTASGHVWCLQDPGAGSPPDPASPVWKTAVAGAATALPLDELYVGSSDGKIHQLDLTTGVDERQFTLGFTVGDLSTDDGTQLFAGTAAGKMYKIPLPLP